jgi:hypothetical protein
MRTQGIVGAVLMALGGMCPLVRVPIMGNWNYFDLDQRLAIAFYLLVAIGLLGVFLGKASFIKFTGWAGLVLVGITLAGVYFKAHDSFGFLHFKKVVNFAAGMVKYKWGWYVIVAGAFLMITVRKPKVVVLMPEQQAGGMVA